MIAILAVRSEARGSRLIQWGLGEGASHLAIETPDYVYHSSVDGVERLMKWEFWDHYELVKAVGVPTLGDQANRIQQELKPMVQIVPYDYPALYYFAWRAFLRKAFGQPFPAKNAGDKRDAMLCVELLYAFCEAYAKIAGRTITLRDRTFGVMTPLDCVAFMKESLGCDAIGYTAYSSRSRS